MPHADLKGCRILVVEDEFFTAMNLLACLHQAGALVAGPSPSLRDALHLVATVPDLHAAVLDVDLVDGLVFPLADRLAAEGVPFIFATGLLVRTIPARFADVPVCEKPVEPAKVAAALSDVVRRH